jgi:hypothetical protein
MSPTSYQTAPPRIKLVVNQVASINVARIIRGEAPYVKGNYNIPEI